MRFLGGFSVDKLLREMEFYWGGNGRKVTAF
jgi:hypothetical protein